MADTAQLAEPFSLRNAGSGVANPSTLPPDVTDLGITQLDQLVETFSTVGSACRSDEHQVDFNLGVTVQANNSYKGLLRPENIQIIISLTVPNSEPSMLALEAALESVDLSENTWLLALPACTSFEDVKQRVTAVLGNLVHDDEIKAIVGSLGEAGADGCLNANAQIIDLTQLHEEVLRRFQVKIATHPSAIAAEKTLIAAQDALTEFLRLNPINPCNDSVGMQTFEGQNACASYNALYYPLYQAVEDASEILAQTLSDLFDQFESDYYPPPDSNDADNKRRGEILLGVIGLVIPLTAADAAIEATLIATTAGFGKIGKFFTNVGEYFDLLLAGNRARIDGILSQGSEVTARVNAIKLEAYTKDYPGLNGMDYADVVRIDVLHGGPDTLRKIADDATLNPNLATQIANNPDYMTQWKKWDDLGQTELRRSFEDIRLKGQYNRRAVTEYLTPAYIANHKAQFADGAVRFVRKEKHDIHGVGNRGDQTEFVLTKAEADDAWEKSGGDPVKLARALGLPDNQFVGSPIVRIDFDDPASLNIDVPSGNEDGTWDPAWLPGGILPDGKLEGVVTIPKDCNDCYTERVVGG